MQAATLDLNFAPAEHADNTGFELGWDHAHHGLVPPAEHLIDGSPVRHGWLAGKAVFGQRTLRQTRHVRQWLQLRTQAWLRAIAFEGQQLTPNYLAQIEVAVCPVTRRALGGVPGAADAPVVERLQASGAYAAGHVVVMSHSVSIARAGCDAAQALQFAKQAQEAQDANESGTVRGLDAVQWRRLASLIALVTPQSHIEATRWPLLALPPNRLRVLNAAQGLQALVTLQLASAGWSQRLRELVGGLIEAGVRQDFQLFVAAVAPRVLEWPELMTPQAQREALEDLWLDERVQRRWQHFVAQLSDAQTEQLLQRAASLGVAGKRSLMHDKAGAVEGWTSDAMRALRINVRGNAQRNGKRAPVMNERLVPQTQVGWFN